MRRFHWSFAIATLIFGFFLGTSTFGSAIAADPTSSATFEQGESLKVCIDKKSGVIRAASKCKTIERAYVLGGPGPQGEPGEKGDVGERGPQGERGQIGPAGASATLPILKTEVIYYLSANDFCTSTNGSVPYVSQVSRSPQTNSVTGVYGGSFRGCYTTIYKP